MRERKSSNENIVIHFEWLWVIFAILLLYDTIHAKWSPLSSAPMKWNKRKSSFFSWIILDANGATKVTNSVGVNVSLLFFFDPPAYFDKKKSFVWDNIFRFILGGIVVFSGDTIRVSCSLVSFDLDKKFLVFFYMIHVELLPL